jgi:hypothetical protein
MLMVKGEDDNPFNDKVVEENEYLLAYDPTTKPLTSTLPSGP